MRNRDSQRFLKKAHSFQQQMNQFLEAYKQQKFEQQHLKELEQEWDWLQQFYIHDKHALNDQNSENFKVVACAVNKLFYIMYSENSRNSEQVEIYVKQIADYLQLIESATIGKKQLVPPDQKNVEFFHQAREKYIKALVNVRQKEMEAEELRNLKEQWRQLNLNYVHLLQEGYCANEQFEAAKQVSNALFEQKNDHESLPKILMTTYMDQLHYYLENVRDFQFQDMDPKRAYLVNLWTYTLQKLEMVSIFYIVRNILLPEYTKRNFRFVDSWLLGHTLLALFYVCVANLEVVPIWIKYVLLIYGCLRMFEILIYQLNVILVHPYNVANYSLNSYRRMTIALIHNFIEIIFWFAGTFVTLQFITDSTVPLAVYTSFTHMVTYSIDLDDSKWTILAIFILQFQAAIGVFMTVLSLARFVSLFPQPASTDPKEQEANEIRHAKLLEEICNLKIAVEENRMQIAENKGNINEIKQGST